MIKVYDSLADLLVGMMPILSIPLIIPILRCMFNIVKEIARGKTIATGERKEKLKGYDKLIEELEKGKTQIDIDKDLQKYFNYKE